MYDHHAADISKLASFGILGIGAVDEVTNKPWGTPLISGLFAVVVAVIYGIFSLVAKRIETRAAIEIGRVRADAEARLIDQTKTQQIDMLESANVVLRERCERQTIAGIESTREVARLTEMLPKCLAATPPKLEPKS